VRGSVNLSALSHSSNLNCFLVGSYLESVKFWILFYFQSPPLVSVKCQWKTFNSSRKVDILIPQWFYFTWLLSLKNEPPSIPAEARHMLNRGRFFPNGLHTETWYMVSYFYQYPSPVLSLLSEGRLIPDSEKYLSSFPARICDIWALYPLLRYILFP